MSGERDGVLVVGARHDPVIPPVLERLAGAGHPCLLLSRADLPGRASLSLRFTPDGPAAGEVRTAEGRLPLDRIGGVWFRDYGDEELALPAGLPEDARFFLQAEWSSFLGGLFRLLPEELWLNHPLKVHGASKPLQLRVAAELGLRVPPTLLTNDPEEAARFCDRHGGAVLYKPFVSPLLPTGRTSFLAVVPRQVRREDFARPEQLRAAPCIFQKLVAKKRDLRVTVIDEHLTAHALEAAAGDPLDWKHGDPARPWRPATGDLAPEVGRGCRKLVRFCGLRYATLDFVESTSGEVFFLEMNPMGQLVSCADGDTETGLLDRLAASLAPGRGAR